MSLSVYEQGFRDGWRRDPDETVSEWADRYRILSSVDSSEPGQWRTSRTPYLREIMDRLSSSDPIRDVVLMFGTQLGKTQTGNNWVGYTIHRSPAPMLVVLPTVEMAKRASKQRLAPMIAETPVLAERVREPRERDSGNTVMVKVFDGGVLMLTGANSSTGLRMMPAARLFLDEVDAYPGDVDGEGDPIALAVRRTSNFTMRKHLYVSSPTIKGLSRIERLYLMTDQRRFFVPCPECGHLDWIRWENIRYTEGQPDSAMLACMGCGVLIEERHKEWMLARGEWRPTATGRARMTGYHLSSLYSPLGWQSWSDCVAEFEAAKQDPPKLKTWVNTILAETWEERGDSVEPDVLKARREKYAAEVPHGVGVLTAAVDVQADRLEVLVVGWGAGEQSWLIAFEILWGDPSREEVWQALDVVLTRTFKHEGGREVRIERAVVDSAFRTEQVYRYCASRLGRGVFAIKGGSEVGKPLVQRPTVGNAYRTPLFVLCTDTGKETVLARLRIATPSPGYVHLTDALDDEFIEQLTAEKAVRRYIKTRPVREWVKVRDRNEAFDLAVYALAALHICGQSFIRALPERAARWSQSEGAVPPPDAAPEPEGGPPPAPPTARVVTRRRGGWVGGFRR